MLSVRKYGGRSYSGQDDAWASSTARPQPKSVLPLDSFSRSSHPASGLRQLSPERIVNASAGGAQSVASVVVADNVTYFLKSLRGVHSLRYANAEAELVAKALFNLIGLPAPAAELVSLSPSSPLANKLGSIVMATTFVDEASAGGPVRRGSWRAFGRPNADVDAFLKMLLVDVLLGNADRRSANFFLCNGRPIPIDNNSGLGTSTNWLAPTNHTNFIKSYHGAGWGAFAELGTAKTVFAPAQDWFWDEPAPLSRRDVQARALDLAQELVTRLGDANIANIVGALPRQIIPDDVTFDSGAAWARIFYSTKRRLLVGPPAGVLRGDALFRYRQDEIRDTLTWRRDHLVAALRSFFSTL